jgi:hypothetical protein
MQKPFFLIGPIFNHLLIVVGGIPISQDNLFKFLVFAFLLKFLLLIL